MASSWFPYVGAAIAVALQLAAPSAATSSPIEEKFVKARPIPMQDVRLTGGPLKHAQDLDAAYLLSLDPDRMLAYYRRNAGLESKAEPYGGWDGAGRNLTGHIAGHHLSAVSLMWAATGDAKFKERADYLVTELAEVQAKNGDGFLSALSGLRDAFGRLSQGEIQSGGFDLNGQWSPWYTLHKTYGGLRDAYRFTGNQKALELEVKFASWAEGVLAPLDETQIQRMLGTEFGGMNEIMVDLYQDTGDKRWLDLSYKFEHKSFLTPLTRHQDNLAGKHGNTSIPKIIGSADRYVLTGNPDDLLAATFFYDQVVQHHSFSTGGHGHDEYFGAADAMRNEIQGRTAETCNIYNMEKLARRLFAIRPDAYYADFQERALFNHILGSMDSVSGATSYMVPVGLGVRREYQNMTQSFTCCVGSGMESHALHADGMYFEDGDTFWINLYAPSTAKWAGAGAAFEMATDFPEGDTAKFKMTLEAPKTFTLAVRRPYWARDGFVIRVNGEPFFEFAAPAPRATGARAGRGATTPTRPQAVIPPSGAYIEIKRGWKTGDTVEIAMPKTLRLEPLADDPNRVAVMYGPLVLAGNLSAEAAAFRRGGGRRGNANASNTTNTATTGNLANAAGAAGGAEGARAAAPPPSGPVFAAQGRPVAEWLKPIDGRPNEFRTEGVVRKRPGAAGETAEVDFVPFYRLNRKTYGVYFELAPPGP